MSKPDNPFVLHSYQSPQLFCDREEETATLLSALENGRNVLLHSPRRYGKTGLIHHVFNQSAQKRGLKQLYFDIYSVDDVDAFNQLLLNKAMEVLKPNAKEYMKHALDWFASLRPSVSFDMQGKPKVSISSSSQPEAAKHTTEIFRIINARCKRLYLAIDEFQQIDRFPGVRMDAVLRTCVQSSPNIRFIFSGSQRHLLLDMFNDAGRPFFASVDQLALERIDPLLYADFSIGIFKRHRRILSQENALHVVNWCNAHTYYVQVFFNRMFGKGGRLSRALIDRVAMEIVKEQDAIMSTLRAALARTQWELFRAISLEGQVLAPTSKDFIKGHNLNSSAAVINALQALVKKELVYVSGFDAESGKPIYEAYNPFMRNWFRYR